LIVYNSALKEFWDSVVNFSAKKPGLKRASIGATMKEL